MGDVGGNAELASGPAPTSLPRFWASGPLGGPLLAPFPFKAGESLLGRCILQGSLGQGKSWVGGLPWGSALKKGWP